MSLNDKVLSIEEFAKRATNYAEILYDTNKGVVFRNEDLDFVANNLYDLAYFYEKLYQEYLKTSNELKNTKSIAKSAATILSAISKEEESK